MSELQEKITKIDTFIKKYTNDIKNHTNDIKGIKETITEYNNKPSTANLKKIAGLNTDIGRRQGLIKYYTQKIKQLQETKKQVDRGVESIEEEKEREEEKEEEKEEEREEEKEESGVKPVKEKKYTPLINKNPGEIEMVDLHKKEEKEEEKEETGFRETIVPRINVSTGTINPNTNPCPQIFNIGKKVNNKFFIPSQFPNLTKKKSLLKGGRKHMKTKNRNRKGISRKEISRNKKKVFKNLAL